MENYNSTTTLFIIYYFLRKIQRYLKIVHFIFYEMKSCICLSNIDIGKTISGAVFQAPLFISCRSSR